MGTLKFIRGKFTSLMRFIAFFIFFAGDSDCSKEKLTKALDKNDIARYSIYSLIVTLIIFITAATYGTFLNHNFFENPTTFNVTVTTEEVRVVTHDVPMSRWPLNNIQLSKNCPDEENDILYETFSGVISINPSVQFILTRIATDSLTVKMRSLIKKSVGDLYDDEDDQIGSLSDCAFFHVKNISERVKSGETIVLPITGDIIVGYEIRFLTHYKTPVLRDGQITILDRRFITGENYSVGPFNLEIGDSFEIQKTSAPSQGFALIDTEPAINLVYRAKGLRGVIKRYQAEDYEIRNSFWSKLYNDEALSITWVLIIILFGIIRISLRYTVN